MISALSLSSCAPEATRDVISPAAPRDLSGDAVKVLDDKSDASAEAVFLDFTFEGRLKINSPSLFDIEVEEQLLYTVGQLNGDRSVSRIDKAQVEVIERTRFEDGSFEIRYQAQLLVAWGRRDQVPERYELILPYDSTYRGRAEFTEAFMELCVAPEAHDVDAGSMWYYYRPSREHCPLRTPKSLEDSNLSTEEVELPRAVRLIAEVSLSEITTVGQYPEYHKVWEDDALNAVVIFGLADEESSASWDAGYQGYKQFYREVHRALTHLGDELESFEVNPPVEYLPLPEQRDITLSAHLKNGRSISVTILLVNNVLNAGEEFNVRYQALTPDADLIIYNGHAGLGANIRALAHKGDWRGGQYSVVFMNGCDTYAYIDDALFKAHAAVNADDPIGSRYVDIVTNAMPAYFFDMSQASLALFNAMLNDHSPLTYEQIFASIPRAQVVLVTGEADNEFVPSPPEDPTPAPSWGGVEVELTLKRGEPWRLETPILEPGTYHVGIEGTGDADLYVRQGLAPDRQMFDCRPFRLNSHERCEVTLSRPNQLFMMVESWGERAEVQLTATRVD